MNCLYHKFSEEVESDLLEFLKLAKEQKDSNRNCNLREYEKWKKILPLKETMKEKLKNHIEAQNNIPVIELDSDSDVDLNSNMQKEADEEILSVGDSDFLNNETDKRFLNDIMFALKESLECESNINDSVKNDLVKLSEIELQTLFLLLSVNLSSEEICGLGQCLQSLNQEIYFVYHLRYLLIPKLFQEYCENIMCFLTDASHDNAELLKKELLLKFSEIQSNTDVINFVHYLHKLEDPFKSALLRSFLFSKYRLEGNSLTIIESLLNNQIEYEALNRLINLLSDISPEYTDDKSFGKLLIKVVDHLGTNIIHVEGPLKYIISSHKSIWKAKLQKTFDNHFHDTMLFSQSFRY